MKKLILSVFAFAVLGLSWVNDAFGAITCRNNSTGARSCSTSSSCPTGWSKISSTCSKTTVGGNITYIAHHDQVIKCTWEDFQGDWAADPGPPISVSQSVEGANNYATCSGWDKDTPVAQLPPGTDSVPVEHSGAPFGFGQFFFNVTYQSAAPKTCIEDLNSGIGNNCTKTSDAQNPKHNTGGSTPPGASLACADLTGGGTRLTYQFACADGVSVTGFLTLVPRRAIYAGPDGVANTVALVGSDDVQIVPVGTTGLSPSTVVVAHGPNGTLETTASGDDVLLVGLTQDVPEFTGPCSADRVAAGKCTMVLGGIPTTTVKVKGQNVTVVDSNACLVAFPAAQVVNAFNSGQTQTLDPKELLFYQEVASEGVCNTTTKLPTVAGLPAAAYGRYCQSDLGLFSDNTGTNFFAGDPPGEGFDNELRVCPTGPAGTAPHTASQDVEQVALTGSVTLEPQGPLNLNCTTGGNTDSAGYKVKIPDQPPLLSVDIDTSPLSDPPKLEGVAPTSAAIIVEDGVRKLLLTYPTCNGLSEAVRANHSPLTNNQNVILHLEGQTNDVGLGPVLFEGEFTIKVNGVQ